MQEVWKDVVGYEGLYQVSNLGRVKSFDRAIREGRNRIPGKMMFPHQDRKGYLNVNLSREGKIFHAKVHRLVAQAFLPNPENLPEVNHINFEKDNNFVKNLEWVTSKTNSEHFFGSEKAEQRNKKLRKEKNPNAKLTSKDVNLLRKLRKEYRIKRTTLALLFGVSLSQIQRIIYNKHWLLEG